MIQIGGYGTVYGAAGDAGVGAEIYSAQRENVTFARYVERARLGIQRRQLRQQEAQAAANNRLASDRMKQEQLRLALEDRRLKLEDERQEDRRRQALLAYELQDAQNRRQTLLDRYAAQRKAEEDAFGRRQKIVEDKIELAKAGAVPESGAAVRLQDGSLWRVGGSQGTDDLYKRIVPVIDSDLQRMDKRVSEAKTRDKELSEILRMAREDVDFAGKKATSEQLQALEDAENAMKENRKGMKQKAVYDEIVRYRSVLAEDPSLAKDISYQDWKDVPWDDFSEDQINAVNDLLNSKSKVGRNMLMHIVRDGRSDFSADAVNRYVDAESQGGAGVRYVLPAEWLSLPWDAMDVEETEDLDVLLKSLDPKRARLVLEAMKELKEKYGEQK